MGLPLAVHALIFARSKCQISDARIAHLKFCYLENIYWMLCLLVVFAGTTSLFDNGLDLHDERQDGSKYCACAALSTGAKEDRIGGRKRSRHNTRVGQEKFIVFSALCFCFSCCLLLLWGVLLLVLDDEKLLFVKIQ